ncbi:phospholipase A2 inhibitor-like [Coccinella septempunctata]|uniref:phospholipase A2 inhibitor-like n=1 Tax=Coccinella septempunctata TaxID=41139 RepID=UPI001D0940C8|nr:phospholipase A2 inhibitor-like [Coccinella septempunctata]
MYVLTSVVFILINIVAGGQCYECDFFENIKVSVIPKSRVPYFKMFAKKNFYGCFEQKQFDQVVVGISVVDQKISRIGDHAVHDLPELNSLSFYGCGIRDISRSAFENLPKLRVIRIDHGNLTTLSGGIFNDLPSLEDLSLFQNQISQIESSTFAAMTALKQVIFSRNQLTAIDSVWFFYSPNLTLLDVSYNKIQEINKYTFEFAPNLKDIFLDCNEIKHIGEKTFIHFDNIEIISLRHNKLTELNSNIFPNKFRVDVLYLNANFLNFIPQTLLEKLSIKVIDLAGNPWKCPCLNLIHKWLVQSNATLTNHFCKGDHFPVCFYDDGGNFCSETVDDKMTKSFLKSLRDLERPVDEECANLS